MKEYLNRCVDDELEFYLDTIGAISIIGPKWCGKTTTAERFAKTVVKFQDNPNNLKWMNLDPSKLLLGEKPILFDEWQEAPKIWDVVRNSVDKIGEDGLYILTGSTVIDKTKISHSGAGRIHRLVMKPMSLYESLESNGKISLIDLFNNPNLDITGIKSDLTVNDLFFAICRGGWPASLSKKSNKSKLSVVYSYLDAITYNDMSSIDGVKRSQSKVESILKSYARNVSSPAMDKTILEDINDNFESMSYPTYNSYIEALKKLFVIENIGVWSPNVRSKTAIRGTPKKQFVDPSIAVASMGLNPTGLDNDLETAGLLFENLCMRDLSIYANRYGGKLTYYRDRYGLEVDCVLRLRDGRYGLIEIKLGSDEEEKAAFNLLKLSNLLKKNMKKKKYIREPSFLAILTGGEYAFTREDGIKVIPIGCLKY